MQYFINTTQRSRPLRRLLSTTALGMTLAVGAQAETLSTPQWTADGKLELPTGYHHWIFLGSPLTPHALNGGEAGFPEFHNVYIHPDAYRAYRQTVISSTAPSCSRNCN